MACIFCEVAQGKREATIVYQDELVTAFRDIRPQAPVHVLIIPNEHIASAAELKAEHGPLLVRICEVASRIAQQEGIAEDGYRLVTNVGRAAGQSVGHLHFHLVGGRRLGWPPG
ncbi:MAG: histidine triad nucleotide-binding protein [Dehalococcoidales bacterium]|nr:histidine triad nucleotide-binding protein [Dehalococcoidales bacterium]